MQKIMTENSLPLPRIPKKNKIFSLYKMSMTSFISNLNLFNFAVS